MQKDTSHHLQFRNRLLDVSPKSGDFVDELGQNALGGEDGRVTSVEGVSVFEGRLERMSHVIAGRESDVVGESF